MTNTDREGNRRQNNNRNRDTKIVLQKWWIVIDFACTNWTRPWVSPHQENIGYITAPCKIYYYIYVRRFKCWKMVANDKMPLHNSRDVEKYKKRILLHRHTTHYITYTTQCRDFFWLYEIMRETKSHMQSINWFFVAEHCGMPQPPISANSCIPPLWLCVCISLYCSSHSFCVVAVTSTVVRCYFWDLRLGNSRNKHDSATVDMCWRNR